MEPCHRQFLYLPWLVMDISTIAIITWGVASRGGCSEGGCGGNAHGCDGGGRDSGGRGGGGLNGNGPASTTIASTVPASAGSILGDVGHRAVPDQPWKMQKLAMAWHHVGSFECSLITAILGCLDWKVKGSPRNEGRRLK